MADKTFTCKLITPEARLLDAEVTYAAVPMWDGSRGIMPRSGAIVGKLGPGELRLEFPGGNAARSWYVDGGFMQNVGDELTVLASGATQLDELDATDAKAELAEANARKAESSEEMDKITEQRRKARIKATLAARR